jgi:phosphatidylserine/phosphatidylglycerophosphate/cardiolipin synthase-like enzyme
MTTHTRARRVWMLGLIFTVLFTFSCITVPATITETPLPSSTKQPTSPAGETGTPAPDVLPAWVKIYFTDPNPPDQVGKGIDQIVVAEIQNASQTIDVTSFDLNLPSFVNALGEAAQRGVAVRLVYDGENGSQSLAASLSPTGAKFDALAVLKAAGVQVVNGGRSSGLMHDKMIIIDGRILFMGSWNMSYNDTFRNNNNLLEITDPTILANYQAKFDELFVDQRFGTHAEIGAKVPQLTVDGVQIYNYFSPVDHVMDKLVGFVKNAKQSVRFMIFTFTDKGLANAMIEQYSAGLDVAGVIEDRGASQGALVPLACAQVPVKVDGNKYTMHHKVIVIDGHIVITGSFNFTVSADTENDDNLLVIDNAVVARRYLDEYARIEALAKAPNPADINCSK